MSIYKSLSDSIDFITNKTGPHFIGIRSNQNFYHIYCITEDWLYKIKWNDEFIFFLNKQDLMKHVLKNIKIITIEKFGYDKKPTLYYFKGAVVILRCYRKYKLRTAKIKNDLVIRGLSERWFHPSRLTFEC